MGKSEITSGISRMLHQESPWKSGDDIKGLQEITSGIYMYGSQVIKSGIYREVRRSH